MDNKPQVQGEHGPALQMCMLAIVLQIKHAAVGNFSKSAEVVLIGMALIFIVATFQSAKLYFAFNQQISLKRYPSASKHNFYFDVYSTKILCKCISKNIWTIQIISIFVHRKIMPVSLNPCQQGQMPIPQCYPSNHYPHTQK